MKFTVGVFQLVRFGSIFAQISQDLLIWLQGQARTLKSALEFSEGELGSIAEGNLGKGVRSLNLRW